MAASCGCGEFTEDIVQEMYIRLHKYVNTPDRIMYNDKEINKSFVYITIRNLAYDLQRAKRIGNEVIDRSVNIDDIDAINEDDDLLDIDELESIVQESMKGWNAYDKILFGYVYTDGISMRKLSRDTGISLRSIWNTINNAKQNIKETAAKKGVEGLGRCN